MKLVKGGELARPNVCWICQRTPAIGSPVIDTEKYFEGFPHNLQGKMYVCDKCATQMAGFFDLADAETVRLARAEADKANLILRGLKLRLDAVLSDLRNVALNPGLLIGEVDGSIREESTSGERASEAGPSDISNEDRASGNPRSGAKRGHRAAKVAAESSDTEA